MIPIGELRRNNLLRQGDDIATVRGLPADDFIQYSIESRDNEIVYGEPYESFDPIELTGEWLDKCNVVKRSVYGTTVIARIVDNIGIPDYVKSVHTLQNWYYWTFNKTELNIK